MDKQTPETTKTRGADDSGPNEERSVVQVLFGMHSENDNTEYADVKRCIKNLLLLLDGIPDNTKEKVTDIICDLCVNSEFAGFVGGMRTAYRLSKELST